MARTPNTVPANKAQALKEKVKYVYALGIENPVDCHGLSDAIIRKTKHYLSPATLKRFMGFYASGFQDSYQTLNVLAVYCGYDSWNHFVNQETNKGSVTKEELALFKNIFNIKDYYNIADNDETMQLVSRRIAERLRVDPFAFESVIPDLAKNKLAQVFYFEHFPDYDNLVSFQYKGYIEYLKCKKTPEAQIFGHCLLFLELFCCKTLP
ncbi:MAG: hypothetical protein JST67_02205 [Bacteroidetes bacterium]|nr:hypothetical protein [Bacteroidota bacterium]